MLSEKSKLNVCYVLSYSQPQYVRTTFLLDALSRIPGVTVLKAINSSKGFLRYAETIAKLLAQRIKNKPDVYVLGFRGYELFLPVRLITFGKPLIYDEFINPYLWFAEEHKKVKKGSAGEKTLRWYTGLMLKRSQTVLSDTNLHADYSSKKLSIDRNKFTTIYVGTDEETFLNKKPAPVESKYFNVFFYGNFLPLHGLGVILDAAQRLKNKPIRFTVIGGAKRKEDMDRFLSQLEKLGLKNVAHKPWVDFKQLPKYIGGADLCLGGPFGATPQSRKVITGKTFQFLAMAKPTVIGKIPEEVGFKNKGNCLLVKQGSAAELSRAIKWAFENQNSLPGIGQMGNRLYKERFSVQAQLPKVKKLLFG